MSRTIRTFVSNPLVLSQRRRIMNRSTQLVIDGVKVPANIVNDGYAAAYVCARLGECAVYGDQAYCARCNMRNEFYHEHCRNCGAPKPWLFRDEIQTA